MVECLAPVLEKLVKEGELKTTLDVLESKIQVVMMQA